MHVVRITTNLPVADIETAIEFAENSPVPAPDQLLVDVYTEAVPA